MDLPFHKRLAFNRSPRHLTAFCRQPAANKRPTSRQPTPATANQRHLQRTPCSAGSPARSTSTSPKSSPTPTTHVRMRNAEPSAAAWWTLTRTTGLPACWRWGFRSLAYTISLWCCQYAKPILQFPNVHLRTDCHLPTVKWTPPVLAVELIAADNAAEPARPAVGHTVILRASPLHPYWNFTIIS